MASPLRFRRGWHKYNARRAEMDGYKFDSLAEARRYAELKILLGCGQIADLKVHPKFPIAYAGHKICSVELDFAYRELKGNGRDVYLDVKGVDTPMSRLKRRLIEAFYGIHVEVVR